ncbi:unnamed protein product, partial [Amoebophrya sp. A120]|eukprot:GSA120T00018236001.1
MLSRPPQLLRRLGSCLLLPFELLIGFLRICVREWCGATKKNPIRHCLSLTFFLLFHSFTNWQSLVHHLFVPRVVLCTHWQEPETGIRLGFDQCDRKSLGAGTVMATSFFPINGSVLDWISAFLILPPDFFLHDHDVTNAFFVPRHRYVAKLNAFRRAAWFKVSELGTGRLRAWFSEMMNLEGFHRLPPWMVKQLLDYELARRATKGGRQRVLRTTRRGAIGNAKRSSLEDNKPPTFSFPLDDRVPEHPLLPGKPCSVFSFGIQQQKDFDEYYLPAPERSKKSASSCRVFSFAEKRNTGGTDNDPEEPPHDPEEPPRGRTIIVDASSHVVPPASASPSHQAPISSRHQIHFEQLALGNSDSIVDVDIKTVQHLPMVSELQSDAVLRRQRQNQEDDAKTNPSDRFIRQKRLPTVMKENQVGFLDVLRLDIGGAEWDALRDVEANIQKIGVLSAKFRFLLGHRDLPKFFSLLCDPEVEQEKALQHLCFDLAVWEHYDAEEITKTTPYDRPNTGSAMGGCGSAYPCVTLTATRRDHTKTIQTQNTLVTHKKRIQPYY